MVITSFDAGRAMESGWVVSQSEANIRMARYEEENTNIEA